MNWNEVEGAGDADALPTGWRRCRTSRSRPPGRRPAMKPSDAAVGRRLRRLRRHDRLPRRDRPGERAGARRHRLRRGPGGRGRRPRLRGRRRGVLRQPRRLRAPPAAAERRGRAGLDARRRRARRRSIGAVREPRPLQRPQRRRRARRRPSAEQPPIYALAVDDDPSSPTRWGGPFGKVALIVELDGRIDAGAGRRDRPLAAQPAPRARRGRWRSAASRTRRSSPAT